MNREIKKNMDDTIMEAKRFLNAYSPPKPSNKIDVFKDHVRRKVSDLLTWFIFDTSGCDVSGMGRGKKRDFPRPSDLQIR